MCLYFLCAFSYIMGSAIVNGAAILLLHATHPVGTLFLLAFYFPGSLARSAFSTVKQQNGERFKTLAKNVEVLPGATDY